jgi:hypothetical protein
MVSRADKMYGKSPKIVEENGKKVVKRGPTEAEIAAARVSDGTAGIPINGKPTVETK